MKKILLIATFLLLSACGRKGALMPPEALVPAAVESLRVSQKGDNFLISWTPPGREQGGRPLKDLAGFRILKREIKSGDIDCPSCPDSWLLLTNIELDFPAGVKRSGNYYIYQDETVRPNSSIQYRLVAYSKNGGMSYPVTTVARKKVVAPPPPLLQAKAVPPAIHLTFAKQSAAGEGATSFNIYRRQKGEPASLLPINPLPLTTAAWVDEMPQYGRTYLYTVTAVSTENGQQVESAPSNEAEILFTMAELE